MNAQQLNTNLSNAIAAFEAFTVECSEADLIDAGQYLRRRIADLEAISSDVNARFREKMPMGGSMAGVNFKVKVILPTPAMRLDTGQLKDRFPVAYNACLVARASRATVQYGAA